MVKPTLKQAALTLLASDKAVEEIAKWTIQDWDVAEVFREEQREKARSLLRRIASMNETKEGE